MVGHEFWNKNDVIVVIATACATVAIQWVCEAFNAESYDGVEAVAQLGMGGQNIWKWFWTKYDLIVAITTACATTTTNYAFGEFDAGSCGSVEMVTQGGIIVKSAWAWFLGKIYRHCCQITACATMAIK